MKKKKNKNIKLEKLIKSIIDKYAKILLLDKHTIELHYGVKGRDSLMETTFNYPYLDVNIHYGVNLIQYWKEGKDIIPIVVHELCHPITDPLYGKASARYVSIDEITDEREKLTDYISNIVIKNNL